ncbi:MAG: STAS/SEC14 domain-containing protein [Myxococcaceae bacterium]|nr:STAS/SEC14 domain-containing protein [Myxococcaceae bacterium]
MAETIIFKNASAVLRYHSEGIVHHEFLGRMVGQDFRDILERGLQQLKKTGARKWLSDDRKNTVLDEVDTRWAQTDWFPRAHATGWKYWAIVNPERAVGQLQMRSSAKQFEMMGGVEVRFFTNPGEALAWLKSAAIDPVMKAG